MHAHVLDHVRNTLERSRTTTGAVLCAQKPIYMFNKIGDLHWGCGYRNIQMLLSARFADRVYSIKEIQQTIEEAWREGFDEPGADHFKSKLVGKRKWIGTPEAYVLFSKLGIKTEIIDFPFIHKDARSAHIRLHEYVVNYFTLKETTETADTNRDSQSAQEKPASRVTVNPNAYPLFFQHQGHSRTIVGIETCADGTINLLVFDPGFPLFGKSRKPSSSKPTKPTTRRISNTIHQDPSLPSAASSFSINNRVTTRFRDISNKHKLARFRVDLQKLSRKNEFQLIRIFPESLSHEEIENRKIIKSTRIVD